MLITALGLVNIWQGVDIQPPANGDEPADEQGRPAVSPQAMQIAVDDVDLLVNGKHEN